MLAHLATLFNRILLKNKIQNGLSIIGLVIGMMSVVMITKYLSYAVSYDSSHSNGSNLFELHQSLRNQGINNVDNNLTYPGLGSYLYETYPEVIANTQFNIRAESLVQVDHGNGNVVSHIENRIFNVDSSFLRVFPFIDAIGACPESLANPGSVVITNSIAKKYFRDENPVGKTIKSRLSWGGETTWTITCVVADPPKNSKVRFEFLVSQKTHTENLWDIPSSLQFVLFSETPNPEQFSSKVSSDVSGFEVFSGNNLLIDIEIQPLAAKLNPLERILALVGVLILALSCINFINISFARFSNRNGELTVLRSIGLNKQQIVLQFFLEGLYINVLAGIIAIITLFFSFSYIAQLSPNNLVPLFDNSQNSNVIIMIILIMTICINAIYPAVFCGKLMFLPQQKKHTVFSQGGMKLRRILVTIQFIISTILIAGTFAVSSQVDFLMNKDLGFSVSNKVVINQSKENARTRRRNLRSLKIMYAKLPWVEDLTSSTTIPAQSYRNEAIFSAQGTGKSALFYINGVDTSFTRVYDLEVIEGIDFLGVEAKSNLRSSILVNQAAAQELGYNPKEILGVKLYDEVNEETYEVIGVVKNYHKTSFKEQILPIVLKYNPRRGYISLKVHGNSNENLSDKIIQLQSKWEEVHGHHPFQYFFLDELFYTQYDQEIFYRRIFQVFTSISIVLS